MPRIPTFVADAQPTEEVGAVKLLSVFPSVRLRPSSSDEPSIW